MMGVGGEGESDGSVEESMGKGGSHGRGGRRGKVMGVRWGRGGSGGGERGWEKVGCKDEGESERCVYGVKGLRKGRRV